MHQTQNFSFTADIHNQENNTQRSRKLQTASQIRGKLLVNKAPSSNATNKTDKLIDIIKEAA